MHGGPEGEVGVYPHTRFVKISTVRFCGTLGSMSIYHMNHELNKQFYYDKGAMDGGRQRANRNPIFPLQFKIGDRVKFFNDRRWWDVRAHDSKTTVLTRSGNFGGPPVYTIIVWEEGRRGPHDSWGFPAETDEDCAEIVSAFSNDDLHLSERRAIHLDIEKTQPDLL